MDARRFFLEALPQLIVAAPQRFASLSGTVAVSVKDQGKFTVHLGDLAAPVVEGFARDASAKLWFLDGSFSEFLDGTLPAQVTTRRLIMSGDGDAVARFGQFLSETAAVLRLKKPGR